MAEGVRWSSTEEEGKSVFQAGSTVTLPLNNQ